MGMKATPITITHVERRTRTVARERALVVTVAIRLLATALTLGENPLVLAETELTRLVRRRCTSTMQMVTTPTKATMELVRLALVAMVW